MQITLLTGQEPCTHSQCCLLKQWQQPSTLIWAMPNSSTPILAHRECLTSEATSGSLQRRYHSQVQHVKHHMCLFALPVFHQLLLHYVQNYSSFLALHTVPLTMVTMTAGNTCASHPATTRLRCSMTDKQLYQVAQNKSAWRAPSPGWHAYQ